MRGSWLLQWLSTIILSKRKHRDRSKSMDGFLCRVARFEGEVEQAKIVANKAENGNKRSRKKEKRKREKRTSPRKRKNGGR